MILKSAEELRGFAKRHPWLEAGQMPPLIMEDRGKFVEAIGLSLNH